LGIFPPATAAWYAASHAIGVLVYSGVDAAGPGTGNCAFHSVDFSQNIHKAKGRSTHQESLQRGMDVRHPSHARTSCSLGDRAHGTSFQGGIRALHESAPVRG